MTMSDPLGDLVARIKNGQRAQKEIISAPASKFHAKVLDVLQREGFIRGYKSESDERGVSAFQIELKYDQGQPMIREISRISKPGRRIYRKVSELPRYYNGLGISIVSTPRGVLSDHEARDQNVGGEILCQVF